MEQAVSEFTGKKTVGVLGGMGPEASALFYSLLTTHTQADKDQDHIELLLYSQTSTPDRSASLLVGDSGELRKALLAGGRLLQDAGAELLAIPCNTAHVCLQDLQAELRVPVLNMVALAASRARELTGAGARIAMLATDGTVRAGLYQRELERLGLLPCLPAATTQAVLMRIIYADIKAGRAPSSAQLQALRVDVQGLQCDLALLACTELSLLADRLQPAGFYLDALAVLARATIEQAGAVYCDSRTAAGE